MVKYGKETAPAYDLSLIKHKVIAFYGDKDRYINQNSMDILKRKLCNSQDLRMIKYDKWAHLTFEIGKDIQRLANDMEGPLKDTAKSFEETEINEEFNGIQSPER